MLGMVGGRTPALAYEGSGWEHALRIARRLRSHPPRAPLVLLLGGSCAREALVSDASWAADVGRLTGSPVVAYDLGSKNQTFEQDVALVKALPRVPMLVFIGVNRGRFAAPPTTTTTTTPVPTKGTYHQHHYHTPNMWTLARKQQEVRYWMRERYPVFEQRLPGWATELDTLVSLCEQRGYSPVLLDLPRNTAVIGNAFDAPDRQFLSTTQSIAASHDVPFLDFVDDIGLDNDDFYDLDHLLASGRPKFQGRLAQETARLLTSLTPRASEVGSGASGEAGSAVGTTAPAPRSHSLAVAAGAVLLVAGGLAVQRRRVVVRRRRRARERRRRRATQLRRTYATPRPTDLPAVRPGPFPRHPVPPDRQAPARQAALRHRPAASRRGEPTRHPAVTRDVRPAGPAPPESGSRRNNAGNGRSPSTR